MAPLDSLGPSEGKNGRGEFNLTAAILPAANPTEPQRLFNGERLSLRHGEGFYYLFDFQPSTPLSAEEIRQLEKACPVKRANFYVGDLKIVALGNDIFTLSNHGEINSRVIKEIDNAVSKGIISSHLPSEGLADYLRQTSIAGYIEQGELKIRIDEFPRRASEDLKILLKDWVARYRTAIELADAYVEKFGGSVTLLPLDDFGLNVAKASDKLHRVSQLPLGGEKGVQKQSQLVHGSIFLNSSAGTQYKTIYQFERDLFDDGLPNHGSAPELYPRFRNRHSCLQYLKKLSEIMSPDHRNREGRRQAQFLLLHPSTEQLLSELETGGVHELRLSSFATDLQNTYKTQDKWSLHLNHIERELRNYISILRSVSAPASHYDYHNNHHFTEILTSILHPTNSGKLKLWAGVHTQLDAKDIGEHITLPNGERELIMSANLSAHELSAIRQVRKSFPHVRRADWFCMCVPHTALTEDPLTPKAVKHFETYADDSLVFLFGSIQGREQRIVIRTDPYRESSWFLRNTERVTELLNSFSPKELTELVHEFKSWQSYLLNYYLQLTSDRRSKHLPPFEVHGDHLIREYLDGKVAGLLNRCELPKEHIVEILKQLGPICATYFIAQRPTLSLREILIDGLEGDDKELSVLPIGLSETFCNRRAANQHKEDFIQESSGLFGAHAASWISSFIYGKHCDGFSSSARKKLQRELLLVWRNSLRESLMRAQGHSDAVTEVVNRYHEIEREFASSGRTLPPEFNLKPFLSLTRQIIAKKPHEIDEIVDSFYRHAQYYTESFDATISELSSHPSPQDLEELIYARYSLLNNNLFTDEAATVGLILDNRLIPTRSFSVKVQTWLTAYADTVIKVNRIVKGDKGLRIQARELILSPLQEGYTLENYRTDIKKFPASIRLSDSEAARFYAAVRGLVTEYTTSSDEAYHRKLKSSVSKLSSGLLSIAFLTRYRRNN